MHALRGSTKIQIGIVMSTLHGVAKQATAVAVKIYDAAGGTNTLYVHMCIYNMYNHAVQTIFTLSSRIIRGIMYAVNRISTQGRQGVIK